MARTSEKIKRWIMYYSFQERKQRELTRYKQKISELQSMDPDALEMQYINNKTEYEHRKNVMSIFMLTIVLSVLMNVWQYFYTVVENLILYSSTYPGNDPEAEKVIFVIFIILVVFISTIIVGILYVYTRRMRQVYKEIQILEEIRNKRNG